MIEEKIVETFIKLFLALSKETAIHAHEYIESHNRISGYGKYPIASKVFSQNESELLEIFEGNIELVEVFTKSDINIYKIPKYEMKDFPDDLIQYSAIFNGYDKDRIDCTTLLEFNSLLKYVNGKTELKELLTKIDDIEKLKFKLKQMNIEIVERYMYNTNATHTIADDIEEKIGPFVIEKLARYLESNLNIDIYIPICLATFEDDSIELCENVEIIRISDDIQKSRQQVCLYESSHENNVAACATHMIVLHGFHLENSTDLSIHNSATNIYLYPLQKIDNIIATIRVITGYNIGYAQILLRPLGWIDKSYEDLIPLYGAKGYFIKPNRDKILWLDIQVSKINQAQLIEIQKLYNIVIEYEKNDKKSNLLFALKCLNRCMLRDEKDDMVIDATIGLESLLSEGTKGEITYTISNRIPIVFAHTHSRMYTTTNCRSIMKKIYNYRSKIVHGGKIKDKDKYCEINNNKIEIEKIAIDFLRYTLSFVFYNQEFLDAKKFDEYIDDNI